MTRALLAAALIAMMASGTASAKTLTLQLPVTCELGRECFVQQYVDLDPGEGVIDYACGQQTYDGHKGTDIRLRSLKDVAQGYDVVAAAHGTVKGRRDGMVDRILRSQTDLDPIKERECGNGVLLDHGGGWQTQFCHMRNGSIRVQTGDQVSAGDVLGQIGYSGKVEFPHLHITVRRNGEVIDPFKGLDTDGSGCGPGSEPLWRDDALAALGYRNGQLLDVGFAGGRIELQAIEAGTAQGFVPSPESPALVAWGWAINLLRDDQIFAVLTGPDAQLAQNRVTLKSNKAQYMLFAGKKRAEARWPSGRYTAFFGVVRDGKAILRAARPFRMP